MASISLTGEPPSPPRDWLPPLPLFPYSFLSHCNMLLTGRCSPAHVKGASPARRVWRCFGASPLKEMAAFVAVASEGGSTLFILSHTHTQTDARTHTPKRKRGFGEMPRLSRRQAVSFKGVPEHYTGLPPPLRKMQALLAEGTVGGRSDAQTSPFCLKLGEEE